MGIAENLESIGRKLEQAKSHPMLKMGTGLLLLEAVEQLTSTVALIALAQVVGGQNGSEK